MSRPPAAPRTSLACLCCSVALIAVGGATSPLVERAGAGAGSSAGDTRQQQKNSSYDFAHFESAVLPAFLGSFKIGSEVGSYGGTPGAIAGTPFGSRVALKALDITNQLNVSDSERDEWKAFMDSFQDDSGLWANYSRDGVDCADPNCHNCDCKTTDPNCRPNCTKLFDKYYLATWELTDVYLLLGRQPARNITRFEAIANDPSTWGPTFLPVLNFSGSNTSTAPLFSCGSVWGCAHALAAIPVVLAATGHRSVNADFFAWLIKHVKAHLDPSTGMLCPPLCKDSSLGECSSSLDICLGGGTPVHAMLTFLGESWPSPQGVQEFAMKLQRPDGLWWAPWASADQLGDVCMSYDGLFHLAQPCRQPGAPPCSPAALQRINRACTAIVSEAHAILDDLARMHEVFDLGFHYIPVALATVAECQSWFPEMVVTTRPWKPQQFP